MKPVSDIDRQWSLAKGWLQRYKIFADKRPPTALSVRPCCRQEDMSFVVQQINKQMNWTLRYVTPAVVSWHKVAKGSHLRPSPADSCLADRLHVYGHFCPPALCVSAWTLHSCLLQTASFGRGAFISSFLYFLLCSFFVFPFHLSTLLSFLFGCFPSYVL